MASRLKQNHPTEPPTTADRSPALNLRVVVRCRPVMPSDKGFEIVAIENSRQITLTDPAAVANKPEEAFRINRSKSTTYAFDTAFSGDTKQSEVFSTTAKPLLDGVVSGFNATVFAYGATGAGKTHTMLGGVRKPGVMLLTVRELFKYIKSWDKEREFTIKLSYLEIYNEVVRDLITPSNDQLDIREDPIRGNVVSGLHQIFITSPKEITGTITAANKNRTQEPTMANETSSRSHAVLQITVEQKEKATSNVLIGKLSLIDLAGSERAAKTFNRGIRLLEGANINRSLLALGNCINALFEQSEKGGKVHIPYRDSKLTRLLKDSLGGNCRTVMIACISPISRDYDDTHNTLKYANRAKNIKISVQKNIVTTKRDISQYDEIVMNLTAELSTLKKELDEPYTPNLPQPDSNELKIAVDQHFIKEAQARKHLAQLEQDILQLGFDMYSCKLEMSKGNADPELSTTFQNKKEQLEAEEENLSQAIDEVNNLEAQRVHLEGQWKTFEPQNPTRAHMKCNFSENVLKMNHMQLRRKETHCDAKVRQKEMYIKCLENQVALRDKVIDRHRNMFRDYNLNTQFELEPVLELSMIQELANSSMFVYNSDINRKNGGNSVSLPPLERTQYASISQPDSPTGKQFPTPKRIQNIGQSKHLRISVPQSERGMPSGPATNRSGGSPSSPVSTNADDQLISYHKPASRASRAGRQPTALLSVAQRYKESRYVLPGKDRPEITGSRRIQMRPARRNVLPPKGSMSANRYKL